MIDFYKEEFEIRKNSPLWWHNKASDLFASAGALHYVMKVPDEEELADLGFERGFSMVVACSPVYEMLFGMSFEALLKAICVVKGKEVPATHALVDLVNLADIAISEKEKAVFEYLTESVVWNGRYPVPKKQAFLEKHWKHGNDLLFDKLPKQGAVQFKIANDTLSWEKLSTTWRRLSNEFFTIYI